MGFLIRLEPVASAESPEDAVRTLANLPHRLDLPAGVGVVALVNGHEAFAFRGMDADEVIRLWRRDSLTSSSGQRRIRKAAR
jgi:hypothetical protein